MKKLTFLLIIMGLILVGGSTSIYAQKDIKQCYCSNGDQTLTPEEDKLLRDNINPTTFRSILNKPYNWDYKSYLDNGKESKVQVFDSKGTEFWLTMMRNYNTSSPDLYLDITGSENASGTVEIAGIGFSQSFSVVANTITRVTLPDNAMVGNDEIANKGIHVISDNEVTVYGMNRIAYTTDAFLGLPVDILATQYLAMTYAGYSGASFAPEFAIVSPYDNNNIQIIPASNTLGGFIAGNTYNITLNAGQVYQAIGTGDLTGSVIQATLPVAFFSGNTCTNIPVGYPYCDHIVEQIPPNTTWGSTFVTYPLAGRANGDTWRFLAAQDNTDLFINSVLVTTLNFGDYYETILTTSAYITSSNPILTAQFSNGNTWDPQIPDNGDPFMMIIPPFQQFMSNYTFATPSSGFSLNYANLTVESVGLPFQYLDNVLIDPSVFNVISTSDFSGAALPLTVGTHNSNNLNANHFGIYVYGFYADDSYGYPGGLSLEFINQGSGPVITLTPETIIINTTSQTAGTAIEITALITDAVDPFVQSATLYYRHTGDVPYLSAPMVHGSGDVWSGIVPAGTVLFPGFQYYIFATDGQLSATSPGVDPVNNPYSVAVENDPPLIIHTPVAFAEIGTDIPIAATVTDVTDFLQSVQLFYRVAGGNPVYTMLAMNNTSGNLFEATIPGAQMTAQGIEYYIKATDNYGVFSTSGTADIPYFIAPGTVQCVNPINGGEIGYPQGNCGEYNPEPFSSINPPTGYIGNLEYKWQYSTDMVLFIDIPNSNTDAFDPDIISQTTWYKRLARVDCMNDWTGAAESNILEVTIEPGVLPGPAGMITGDATVCNYSQAIYCVPYVTDATSYIWEYSGTDVVMMELKCQSCIVLLFNEYATSGILTVRGHNDCGDGIVSPDFPIIVDHYPEEALPIIGPKKVTQGEAGVQYHIPVIANAISYVWAYTGTGVTINGSGNAVMLDFAIDATSGILSVYGQNNCGNGNTVVLAITVNPYIPPILGPNLVAPGQKKVPYSVEKVSSITSYVWAYTGSGVTINGNSNTITLDFSAKAKSGVLSVVGSGPGSNTFKSELSVKVALGFSNNEGKSSEISSNDENNIETVIDVYPNPTDDMINFISNKTLKSVIITNSTGQVLVKKEVNGNTGEIDVSDFVPGIYIVKLETNCNFLVKKISVR